MKSGQEIEYKVVGTKTTYINSKIAQISTSLLTSFKFRHTGGIGLVI